MLNGGTAAFYDRGSTANATLQSGTDVVGGVTYVFTNWSSDASGTGLTSGAITMSAAKTATANWIIQQFSVTFSQTGILTGGSNDTGEQHGPHGREQRVHGQPAAGNAVFQ